jgi:hypothetical protein
VSPESVALTSDGPLPRAVESVIGVGMTEFSFPCVSMASSGGEYFQILFTNGEDTDDPYFLIQRQFESCDGGLLYIESHEQSLCGHFKIRAAHLERNMLRLELASKPTKIVQINFQADATRSNQLRRVLRIIIPAGVLTIQYNPC